MHYLIEIITEKAIIVNKYCSTNHMAQATIWMWKRKEMRTQRKKKEGFGLLALWSDNLYSKNKSATFQFCVSPTPSGERWPLTSVPVIS